MRFPNHFALAELPWFEVRDERLIMVDPDVGPIVDVHTHLALAYGPGGRIDPWKLHKRTLTYLPQEGALDLDVYMNLNFTERDMRRMKVDLVAGGVTPWGMRTTHTAANLQAEMKDLGIAHSVLLPIDFPKIGKNSAHYLEVAQQSDAVLSMGSVHPKASGREAKLEAQKRAGAKGIKIHPAVQSISPDDPAAMELYRMCADLDLPIFFHAGPVDIETRKGRHLCQMKNYVAPVKEHPQTTFIMGHAGALQMDIALQLSQEYDNVWLETASQSLTNVKRLVAEAPADRLMLGSDWPFYHQSTAVVKGLLATEGDPGARKRLMWDNAASLYGLTAP